MGIREQTVQRAVTMLVAAGAKFHIVSGGGVFGGPIVPDKPPRTRVHLAGPKNESMIAEAFAGMEVGDVRVLKPQTGDTAQRLQGNVCAAGVAKFGKGSIMTTVTNGAVEVLRVA